MGISQAQLIYPTPTSLPRGQKARKISLPPPIGGWNTRDDPAQMGITDATDLVNFFPEINQVAVRGGYTEHATIESNTGVQADTTNYLDGGDIAAFDALTDFTLEFWTQHSGGSQGQKRLVGKRNGALGGFNVDITESSDRLVFSIGAGTFTFNSVNQT